MFKDSSLRRSLERIHWIHALGQLGGPIWVLTRFSYIPLQRETEIWAYLYGILHGLCITIGYHRLWAHRSFRANIILRIFLAVVGAGMVQRPIIWWVQAHRAHHRYVDTDRDPYNARRGLFYSHIGWLLVRQDSSKWDIDISDLLNDPVVVWQERYYIPLAVFSSFIVPTLVAGWGWGNWRGGIFWAGLVRLVISWHCTFTVNSLAHWMGTQPFSQKVTARNNLLVGILAAGEGYHNFHHQFPFDYRNGVYWYDFDPSKWVIWLLAQLGLARGLNTATEQAIDECRSQSHREQQREGRCLGESSRANRDTIPVIEWDEYVQQVQNGRALVAIAGSIYDVSGFLDKHPGGEQLLRSACGKDATAMFHGGSFDHSPAASDLLSTMRVYIIQGGGPVEVLRTRQ
ncbi:hypothetical protein BDV26DRAFT_303236 [Aspergillus bertholletiae]|uniref:Acyl-CoA desaturase n=1 Tax=Aspergillus bertholletiae TaxID=1226010 RepID=A0A5N7AMJ6_9EURO|nr:hypothetical protein BDV26DRAFT_303236 [Aspergillus bertholletiae]